MDDVKIKCEVIDGEDVWEVTFLDHTGKCAVIAAQNKAAAEVIARKLRDFFRSISHMTI